MKFAAKLMSTVVGFLVIGCLAATVASAGTVSMTIAPFLAGPIPPCEAEFTTTGGPPPAATTIVGSSMAGKAGSSIPCDPLSVQVTNNPVVSFTGTGPWNAQVNSVSVTDLVNTPGCTFTAIGSTFLSTTSVDGHYQGNDTAPGSGSFLCLFLTATVNISDVEF